MTNEQQILVGRLLKKCRERGLHLATAESCTGGLIAAALTDVAGASDMLDRGFVTYSNTAKQQMINVPERLLQRDGAVSESVARAMAEGARVASAADIAVAVTGIAGPGGGSAEKPVGLVHLAVAYSGKPTMHRCMHYQMSDRRAIREATVTTALELLLEAVDQE